jgi:hypothetical protein
MLAVRAETSGRYVNISKEGEKMVNARRILVAGIVLGLVGSVQAAPDSFVVPMSELHEVPPSDPAGTGTAFLTLDPIANTINWTITVSNIDLPVTGVHIHRAPPGVAGPVIIDLDAQLRGAGLADPNVAAVVANPTDYYVNVDDVPFPEGAIRGQLGVPTPVPAPAALGLLALGLVSLRLSNRKLA